MLWTSPLGDDPRDGVMEWMHPSIHSASQDTRYDVLEVTPLVLHYYTITSSTSRTPPTRVYTVPMVLRSTT